MFLNFSNKFKQRLNAKPSCQIGAVSKSKLLYHALMEYSLMRRKSMSFEKGQRKIDASQAALVLLIQIHVRRLWVFFFVSFFFFFLLSIRLCSNSSAMSLLMNVFMRSTSILPHTFVLTHTHTSNGLLHWKQQQQE